ncbi:MAG: phosphatidylglycerol lysyltransferase domain-containing protein [Candidatus Cloacimonadota bacterium]|jgi:hypothetical protein|nr:phosphatidylglycerol lysyltransferase domain-containing protein [Candidatus Cloacimonadota bacterium]
MLKLEPLTTAQIPLLREFLSRYPRQSCDYNICNLLSWGKIYNNQYTLWEGHLVLVNPQYSYLLYPVGPGLGADKTRELFDLYREDAPEAKLLIIPENWQESCPGLDRHFEISDDRDWYDYVYATEKMVNLRGKKLTKKKNLISQFRRANPNYHVLPISKEKHEVIERFTEKWRRERHVEGSYLDTEMKAIQNTLEMWDELPVEGIIVCLDQRIAAYSIFSPQTQDMVTVHFEKFDPDKKGSAQLIYWETARYLQSRYKWINREQDIGLEGLRQAKTSYAPDFMVKFLVGIAK